MFARRFAGPDHRGCLAAEHWRFHPRSRYSIPARRYAEGADRSDRVFGACTCSRGRTSSGRGGSSCCRGAGSDYREKGRGGSCCACCEGEAFKGEGEKVVIHSRFSILDFRLRNSGGKTNSVGRRSRKPRRRICGHASQYWVHGGRPIRWAMWIHMGKISKVGGALNKMRCSASRETAEIYEPQWLSTSGHCAALREIHMRLKSPFETSFGTVQNRRIVLVEVVADGVSGWGEVTAGETPAYNAETTDTAWHVA